MLTHFSAPIRFLVVWLALATAAFAETTPSDETIASAQAEIEAATFAFNEALQLGPRDIPLAGQATLRLPEGYGFVPAAAAGRLMAAMGNHPDDSLQGAIVATQQDGDAGWIVLVRFEDAGYIKDDDARNWNADDLLNNIRTGTEEMNTERRGRGIPELEVIGWVERPQYDAASNRLAWSVSARHKGETGNTNDSVNYNTLALGREGYFSLDLITDLAKVDQHKTIVRTLLASLDFDAGKRYADFNAETDKVAEYGLAALVAGVAAKKLGLFALIAAFALKFAKVIGVAVVVGLASLRKLFDGKSDTPPTDQT